MTIYPLGLDENLGQFRKDLMQRKVEILGQISRGMSTQELGRTQPQVAPASGPDGMDTRRLELPVDKDLLIKDICGLEDIKSALVDVLVTPFFYPGVIPAEHQFHGIMLYGPSGGGMERFCFKASALIDCYSGIKISSSASQHAA